MVPKNVRAAVTRPGATASTTLSRRGGTKAGRPCSSSPRSTRRPPGRPGYPSAIGQKNRDCRVSRCDFHSIWIPLRLGQVSAVHLVRFLGMTGMFVCGELLDVPQPYFHPHIDFGITFSCTKHLDARKIKICHPPALQTLLSRLSRHKRTR